MASRNCSRTMLKTHAFLCSVIDIVWILYSLCRSQKYSHRRNLWIWSGKQWVLFLVSFRGLLRANFHVKCSALSHGLIRSMKSYARCFYAIESLETWMLCRNLICLFKILFGKVEIEWSSMFEFAPMSTTRGLVTAENFSLNVAESTFVNNSSVVEV